MSLPPLSQASPFVEWLDTSMTPVESQDNASVSCRQNHRLPRGPQPVLSLSCTRAAVTMVSATLQIDRIAPQAPLGSMTYKFTFKNGFAQNAATIETMNQ